MATVERHTTVLKDRPSSKDDGLGLILALFMLALAALAFYMWDQRTPEKSPNEVTVNIRDLSPAPVKAE